MSLRDIAVTLVILGLLPACFARPWVGILAWSWIGYMNPHLLAWDFARSLPFAMLVGLATLAGFVVNRDRQRLPREPETILLILLWVVFGLSTLFAQYPDSARAQLIKVSKMFLMTFVTLLVINEPRKLRALLYVIALSIGFFGLKGGIWVFLTGGQFMVWGPPGGSFISSNTGIGLGLNMVLPFLFYLRKDEPRRWLRWLLLAMFLFSIVAVVSTYSRGALIGLVVVLVALFVRSRANLMVLVALGAAAVIIFYFMPERWHERMETISTYEQDVELSALRRLDSWQVAIGLMRESPILGAGFRPFTMENYRRLAPPRPWHLVDHDAHSIYFQVIAEHGLLGIGLYLALPLMTLVSLQGLIRRSRRQPASMGWLGNAARATQVSLVAYLINGAFFSVSYFDLFYHLVAITVLLKVFARQEATLEIPQRSAPVASPGRLPVRVRSMPERSRAV